MFPRAAALNFANALNIGGGYLHGAQAQEEDLCRRIPHLYAQLSKAQYPLSSEAIITDQLPVLRRQGTLQPLSNEQQPEQCCIITAAMVDRSAWALEPITEEWHQNTRRTIRSVLTTAQEHGKQTVIPRAFGCGAFQNPAKLVASARSPRSSANQSSKEPSDA